MKLNIPFLKNKIIRDRFLAGLLTIALSAWMGIDSLGVFESIKYMFKVWMFGAQPGDIYYSGLFFVLSSIIWIWVFTSYLSNDLIQGQNRFEETIAAIYRAPNPFIFNEYPIFHQALDSKLKKFNENSGLSYKEKSNILKVILEDILILTQNFSPQDVKLKGSNVMFYLSTLEFSELIERLINSERIRFTDHKRIETFAGVLLTYEEAVVLLDKKSKRSIPSIGLPVFHKSKIDGEEYQMPGAAYAIFEGNYVCTNVKELISDCQFMGKSVSSQIETYFKKEGKDIKSFASFRIGSSKEPLGVLNIDSSEENVLGSAKEYFSTFNALIHPVLKLIEPLIVDIRNQFIEQKMIDLKSQEDINLEPIESKLNKKR